MSIFQELLFQAELDRREDPESKNEAWLMCGEDHVTTKQNIEELRTMIYERGECYPHRLDDAYLLRFLRAKRSIPARAHRLMVRYCNFREQNPHLWRGVDVFGLSKLGNILEGVLFDRPDAGRIIIFRMNQWDPDEISSDDILRGILLMLEIGIMQPKVQILGGTAIIDCDGLTMKHTKHLTPNFALKLINILGASFPVQQRGFHLMNIARVFEMMFQLLRKVATADEMWKKIHFHRHDLSSLHRYISPECLPKRYGGSRDEVSFSQWLAKIRQYKDSYFDDEMRNLGYFVG